MNNAENDPIPDADAFGNGYRVFIQALEALAMDPSEASEAYGNFNVAWEIAEDVSAVAYLFESPASSFTAEQRSALSEIVEALRSAPPEVIGFTDIKQESVLRMSHAFWAPIRAKARRVVKLLEPVTVANARYMS